MSVRAFEKEVLSGDFFVMGGTVSEYHILSGTKMRGVGRFFSPGQELVFFKASFLYVFLWIGQKKDSPHLQSGGALAGQPL